MAAHAELEAQIDRWRGYVQRNRAISPADVDELEDHLRGEIADRQATGLDDDEAFLVAIKRLGNLDAVSREYAREHSERLWKQLVLVPEGVDDANAAPWRELAVVLILAVGAGVAVKAGMAWIGDSGVLMRNLGLLVFPFVAAYFAWKRRLTRAVAAALVVPFAGLAAVLNLYPFAPAGATGMLAALHSAVILWLLTGLAYAGGRWRSDRRRMDFVRFTGEFGVYYTLLALGGGVLIGLTVATLRGIGTDFQPVLDGWVLPFAVPGALVVAIWLVEAKQQVVENIAPVLTRVFTPLTVAMLVVLLAMLANAGGFAGTDRNLLILIDAILILVLCLLLYSISARDPLAPAGLFDALQLGLVVAGLALDAAMLTAMLARIAEFGYSPNKIAALGLNLLLLMHLLRAAWLSLGFLRGRLPFAAVELWQTRYLPVYGAWAVVVVVVFPPVFGFI